MLKVTFEILQSIWDSMVTDHLLWHTVNNFIIYIPSRFIISDAIDSYYMTRYKIRRLVKNHASNTVDFSGRKKNYEVNNYGSFKFLGTRSVPYQQNCVEYIIGDCDNKSIVGRPNKQMKMIGWWAANNSTLNRIKIYGTQRKHPILVDITLAIEFLPTRTCLNLSGLPTFIYRLYYSGL